MPSISEKLGSSSIKLRACLAKKSGAISPSRPIAKQSTLLAYTRPKSFNGLQGIEGKLKSGKNASDAHESLLQSSKFIPLSNTQGNSCSNGHLANSIEVGEARIRHRHAVTNHLNEIANLHVLPNSSTSNHNQFESGVDCFDLFYRNWLPHNFYCDNNKINDYYGASVDNSFYELLRTREKSTHAPVFIGMCKKEDKEKEREKEEEDDDEFNSHRGSSYDHHKHKSASQSPNSTKQIPLFQSMSNVALPSDESTVRSSKSCPRSAISPSSAATIMIVVVPKIEVLAETWQSKMIIDQLLYQFNVELCKTSYRENNHQTMESYDTFLLPKWYYYYTLESTDGRVVFQNPHCNTTTQKTNANEFSQFNSLSHHHQRFVNPPLTIPPPLPLVEFSHPHSYSFYSQPCSVSSVFPMLLPPHNNSTIFGRNYNDSQCNSCGLRFPSSPFLSGDPGSFLPAGNTKTLSSTYHIPQHLDVKNFETMKPSQLLQPISLSKVTDIHKTSSTNHQDDAFLNEINVNKTNDVNSSAASAYSSSSSFSKSNNKRKPTSSCPFSPTSSRSSLVKIKRNS